MGRQPDAYAEPHRHNAWLAGTSILALAATAAATPAMPAVAHVWATGFTPGGLDTAARYLSDVYLGAAASRAAWWPVIKQFAADPAGATWLAAPLAASAVGWLGGVLANPYSSVPNIHGDAKWAGARDLRRMARAKKVSLEGRHLALGRVGRKTIRLAECLSVLAFAPPGAGKTTAVVVPSILDAPTASQVVIDLKPEL